MDLITVKSFHHLFQLIIVLTSFIQLVLSPLPKSFLEQTVKKCYHTVVSNKAWGWMPPFYLCLGQCHYCHQVKVGAGVDVGTEKE